MRLILRFVGAVLCLGAAGCPECPNDFECRNPLICVSGACESPGSGGNTGTGGGTGAGGVGAGGGIGAGGGSGSGRSKRLSVPGIPQMTQVWCWAACSEMVLAFVNHDVAQCVILSKWYHADCCTNFNACATTAPTPTIQNTILFEAGLTSTLVQRPLSWTEFVSEIDRGFPVILGYQGSFAGHVVVGFGYNEVGQTVDIQDPYYGTFTVPFRASFSYNGGALTWVSTIADFGRFPAFCCTRQGKFGPYANGTIPAAGSCVGTDQAGQQWPGSACF